MHTLIQFNLTDEEMRANLTPKQTKLPFNQEQLDILEEALHVLDTCEQYFRMRDKTNALLHLATPKYSPITKAVGRAARNLTKMLDGDQNVTSEDGEDNENSEASEE